MIKFDMHVHFDFFKSSKIIQSYYNKNKIFSIFATISPSVFLKYKRMNIETDYIKLALGAHPCYIKDLNFQLDEFNKALAQTKYISEVGLDFSKPFKDSSEKQEKVFNSICSKTKNKLLIIHSRRASDRVYEILSRHKNKFIVLHWYSGSVGTLKDFIKLGAYISINHKMIKTKRIQEYLDEVPIERLLIETDAPFTLENNININYFSVYKEIVSYLCKHYKYDRLSMEKKLSSNFYKLILDVNDLSNC
jgi:TatD DNase family protein